MAFAHGWISKVISSNDDLFGKKWKFYMHKCTFKKKGRQEQEGKVEEEEQEEENNRKMR